MSESIQCKVQQIDPVNNYGKIKVHLLALENNAQVKTSAGYNTETDVFCINWKQEDDIPHWLKQGNKIDFPFSLFKEYVTFDRFSNIGVKVLEESNVVDDIKKAFPNTTVENMKDDLQDEGTDFDYGTNNPYAEKAQCMQQAFQACKDKEFFEFFGRDLDALQKLVVTVFLSNR
tara:strand:- start:372 stop:893 length:522 start_codon:yes stop_codon:yes gene_type:complete